MTRDEIWLAYQEARRCVKKQDPRAFSLLQGLLLDALPPDDHRDRETIYGLLLTLDEKLGGTPDGFEFKRKRDAERALAAQRPATPSLLVDPGSLPQSSSVPEPLATLVQQLRGSQPTLLAATQAQTSTGRFAYTHCLDDIQEALRTAGLDEEAKSFTYSTGPASTYPNLHGARVRALGQSQRLAQLIEAIESEPTRWLAKATRPRPVATATPAATSNATFAFIKNRALRTIVERDYRELVQARQAGSVKSVVVLAGTCLEGMLLATLRLRRSSKTSLKAPKKPIDDWKLFEIIEVAVDIGVLPSDIGKTAHGLRDNRNLVHPSKELRESRPIDTTDANLAWAIFDRVLHELTRGQPK